MSKDSSKEVLAGVCFGAAAGAAAVLLYQKFIKSSDNGHVMDAIRNRRSHFFKSYSGENVDQKVVWSMLNAAMWAPFHGRKVPWRFVVLGKERYQKLEKRTRDWYENVYDGTESQRQSALNCIDNSAKTWSKAAYAIPIIMKRAADPSKIMPEWEEMCAVASAVQNMQIQVTNFPDVGVYWSSWHSQ